MIADVSIAFSGVVASSVLITNVDRILNEIFLYDLSEGKYKKKIWRLCLTTEISAKLSAEDTKMMNGDSARYF